MQSHLEGSKQPTTCRPRQGRGLGCLRGCAVQPNDWSGVSVFHRCLDVCYRDAGSAALARPNRITLLRDANGDGIADQRFVLLEGLRQPFGMALVDDQLYVANTDSVVRFP